MPPPQARVAVIGAGLLGTTAALLLDRRGHAVDLIDARGRIWQGASATGEGKIHLGYVYALAESSTIEPVVKGALFFDRIVEEAVGRRLEWRELTSEPFVYVVHPDSLAESEELAHHYERVHQVIDLQREEDPRATYLGAALTSLGVPRMGRTGPRGLPSFATDERAVDVLRLQTIFEEAFSAGSVTQRFRQRVVGVCRREDGWWLDVSDGDLVRAVGPYEVVINATWDQQERLNRMAAPSSGWEKSNYRLRAFVAGQARKVIPAFTVVQGPFGDAVGFAGGRFYASWYPTGLLGFCTGIHPPEEWRAVADEASRDDSLGHGMLDSLADVLPLEVELESVAVCARIVVAHGDTDIGQPDSRLHHRVGPTMSIVDGWVVPRSFKLTNAPLAAADACAALEDLLG